MAINARSSHLQVKMKSSLLAALSSAALAAAHGGVLWYDLAGSDYNGYAYNILICSHAGIDKII